MTGTAGSQGRQDQLPLPHPDLQLTAQGNGDHYAGEFTEPCLALTLRPGEPEHPRDRWSFSSPAPSGLPNTSYVHHWDRHI